MNPKNTKIAQPYAEALIQSIAQNTLDKTISDLTIISSTINNSGSLKKVIINPLLNLQTKKTILSSIFSDKLEGKTLRFLLVLCDRGRISHLESIIEKALELAYKAAHIKTVKLITAIPFTHSQQEAIISKLKKMTGAEQIKLEITINNNLIGGFIVQVNSKTIDTSVQNQLSQLGFYLGATKIN
nr:ATP synthase CF1 delta subunit [Cryptomonas borealis]